MERRVFSPHLKRLFVCLSIFMGIASGLSAQYREYEVVYVSTYTDLNKIIRQPDKTYMRVDKDASMNMEEIGFHLGLNRVYPPEADDEIKQGNIVTVRFTVGVDGLVTDAEVLDSASPSLDAEALRVVESLPLMKPAKKNGVPVPVEFQHFVSFKKYLQPENVLATTGCWLPQFKGGDAAMEEFFEENMVYPPDVYRKKREGRVVLRFTVSPEGEIIKPQVMRRFTKECDQEAYRLVRMMPDWLPAVKKGKYVKSFYSIPVVFKLKEDSYYEYFY